MSLPRFQTELTPEMHRVLQAEAALRRTVASEGRPIAISLPQAAVAAAKQFRAELAAVAVEGRVCVAHKATNSPAVLRALRSVAAIDVASRVELAEVLRLGYRPDNIIATGPKSDRFLGELVGLAGCTIVVDSVIELQRLMGQAQDYPVSVLLRLGRPILNQPGVTRKSRFGLDQEQLARAVELLAKARQITLRGVAFHLDSRSLTERCHAAEVALTTLLELQQQGFAEATVLDIGGGYGTSYGLSPATSQRFEDTIRGAVMGQRPSLTWQERSYGLRRDGQHIAGAITGVDMPSYPDGVDRLRAVLAHRDEYEVSLADRLAENLLELWIEPGSTVCAAAGMFVAEVIEARPCGSDNLVVVDAHRNQMCFEHSEHIADPILLTQARTANDDNYAAYLVGHLCAETDFLSFRRITLPCRPQPGDLMVWTHTGAYRSYFSASRAIGHPLPALYVMQQDGTLKEDV